MIPPTQLKSIYNLPESKLDVYTSQSETIQADYTVEDPDIFHNSFHVNVIRNQLTRNLGELTSGIVEELALGFTKYWGSSPEWEAVRVWPSCLKIVAQSANRVFLGAPQCGFTVFF